MFYNTTRYLLKPACVIQTYFLVKNENENNSIYIFRHLFR